MDPKYLIDVLTQNALDHDVEADAFAAQMERGTELFESALGQKFHEGCADAYRTMAEVLQRILEGGEPLPEACRAVGMSSRRQLAATAM